MNPSAWVAALATLSMFPGAAFAALPPLPPTPRIDVTDVMHGDAVTDPSAGWRAPPRLN